MITFGGVFRDKKGEILQIFTGDPRKDTNSVAELSNIEHGSIIANHQNCQKLVFEGDSKIIILMLKKLENSSSLVKYLDGWKLIVGMNRIRDLLATIPSLVPLHILRKWNTLVDRLVDESLNYKIEMLDQGCSLFKVGTIRMMCEEITRKDMNPHGGFLKYGEDSTN